MLALSSTVCYKKQKKCIKQQVEIEEKRKKNEIYRSKSIQMNIQTHGNVVEEQSGGDIFVSVFNIYRQRDDKWNYKE